MQSRIGILGGTFDPLHLGHLMLAEAAVDRLELDRVLFVPAAQPPHKDMQLVTPIEHRLRMVERAIADNARFALSRADVDRPGPHYTVDMLEVVRREYPDARLFLIIGSDSLHDLVSWRNPSGIIEQSMLAVMRRPDDTIHLETLGKTIRGIERRVVMVEAPIIGIASSELRQYVQSGATIRYQVPDSVREYIAEHHLYRELAETR